MKEKLSSVIFTFLLGFVLILLIVTNIFVFISGPARKYEVDEQTLFQRVKQTYQMADAVYIGRHVHQRKTYVAFISPQRDRLIFYDESGLIFLTIDVPVLPQSLIELIRQGIIDESTVTYGFYEEAVYVIDTEERLQYIDFDGNTVFILRKEP